MPDVIYVMLGIVLVPCSCTTMLISTVLMRVLHLVIRIHSSTSSVSLFCYILQHDLILLSRDFPPGVAVIQNFTWA